MTGVIVELTASEMHLGTVVGSTRQHESAVKGRANKHGMSDDFREGLFVHTMGAFGEIAVAKLLNIYWGGDTNTFKGPDIGSRIQVRARREDWHDLNVRHDDDDRHIFYLVTGLAPHLTVRGCAIGATAKRPEWLKPHGGREPAYFVPQAELVSDLASMKRMAARGG